jgi:glyceraldehyde 3-phosphate dehydrogenase
MDCVFGVKHPVMKEEVTLKEGSDKGPLKGNLGCETKPPLSVDYTNDTRSSILDPLSKQVIGGPLVKIYAWYKDET